MDCEECKIEMYFDYARFMNCNDEEPVWICPKCDLIIRIDEVESDYSEDY